MRSRHKELARKKGRTEQLFSVYLLKEQRKTPLNSERWSALKQATLRPRLPAEKVKITVERSVLDNFYYSLSPFHCSCRSARSKEATGSLQPRPHLSFGGSRQETQDTSGREPIQDLA